MLRVTDIDIDKLDSMTKYPSIPTYHALSPKNGTLIEECINFDDEVIITEKIDGTNARVIVLPDGNVIVGSRKELLWAYGDIIMNPTLGIISTLFDLADRIFNDLSIKRNCIWTFYFEVYGGSVLPARKNYTGNSEKAYRLFDVSVINDFSIFDWDRVRIASWRDNGNQAFLSEDELNIIDLPRVPSITKMNGAELPRDIMGMYKFLNLTIPTTLAALDEKAKGIPEGLVIRTPDRSKIAKIRYEDYAKTLRKRNS